jgi:hypothetical protein
MKKLFIILLVFLASCHRRTIELRGDTGHFIVIKENGGTNGYNLDNMLLLIKELKDSIAHKDSLLFIKNISGFAPGPDMSITYNKDSTITISTCP